MRRQIFVCISSSLDFVIKYIFIRSSDLPIFTRCSHLIIFIIVVSIRMSRLTWDTIEHIWWIFAYIQVKIDRWYFYDIMFLIFYISIIVIVFIILIIKMIMIIGIIASVNHEELILIAIKVNLDRSYHLLGRFTGGARDKAIIKASCISHVWLCLLLVSLVVQECGQWLWLIH